MRVVESIQTAEGRANVIALADGKRPCMKIEFREHKPCAVYVNVVPVWEPCMPHHCTSGSKILNKKHCKFLKATRGIWLLDFCRKDDYVEFSASFMNTKTRQQTTFNDMRIQGDPSNISILIRDGMDEQHIELIRETFGDEGPLKKALIVGVNRVFSECPSLFDWGCGI